MSGEDSVESIMQSVVTMHNAIGEMYPKLLGSLVTLAKKVSAQTKEIAKLKEEIAELKANSQKDADSPENENFKRKRQIVNEINSTCAAFQATCSKDFVFIKKAKVTESSKPRLETTSPKRRDKFTRAERKLLPGYSDADSEPFFKCFADEYDEQTLKDKLSEQRYEFPPAEVRPSFYRLDL